MTTKKLIWIAASFLMISTLVLSFSFQTGAAQQATTWQYKGVSMNENDATLRHYVWEVARPPYGPWDKIQLHRYIKETANPDCVPGKRPSDPRKVLFHNPGTWERAIHATEDTATSQQWYFAANGYDYYAIDFRPSFMPNMDYDQFATYGYGDALKGTADWTYALFREDIKACIDLVKSISGASKVFMSGFSRGVRHTTVYAGKYWQTDLKGMILMDGGAIWRNVDDPATQKSKAVFDASVASFKAESLPAPFNRLLWDVGLAERSKYGALFPHSRNTVTQAPSNNVCSLQDDVNALKTRYSAMGFKPTDIPAPPQTIADVLAYTLYWSAGKANMTNVYEGFQNKEVMVQYLSLLTRWWPFIQVLEDSFLKGYANCPYLDYQNTPDVTIPLIYFGSEFTCRDGSCLKAGPGGPITKSEDVKIIHLKGYGHTDIVVGSKSLDDVKTVQLDWMNSRL